MLKMFDRGHQELHKNFLYTTIKLFFDIIIIKFYCDKEYFFFPPGLLKIVHLEKVQTNVV